MAVQWVGHKGPFGRNVAWTSPDLPGVRVRHCGHPTALRPYWIDGYLNELGTFRLLVDAQRAAERLPAQA